jgi:hypothetical protein
MHTDDNFKNMMSAGVEQPSAEFTNNVMSRIESLYSKSAYQQLVSKIWKRNFIIVFLMLASITIVAAIVTTKDHVSLAIPNVSFDDFYKLTLSIIGFWILMVLNFIVFNNKLRQQHVSNNG